MNTSHCGLLVALSLAASGCFADPLVVDFETGQRREAISSSDLEVARLPDCHALSVGVLADLDGFLSIVGRPDISVYTTGDFATCIGPVDESDDHPDQHVNEGPTPQPSDPGVDEGPTPQPSQPDGDQTPEAGPTPQPTLPGASTDSTNGPTPQPSLPENHRCLAVAPVPQPSGS